MGRASRPFQIGNAAPDLVGEYFGVGLAGDGEPHLGNPSPESEDGEV